MAEREGFNQRFDLHPIDHLRPAPASPRHSQRFRDFAHRIQEWPAGSVFAGLGKEWANLLQGTGCFEDLRRAVVIRNAIGLFVTAVRRYAGTCSKEFRLLRDLHARRLRAPRRRSRRKRCRKYSVCVVTLLSIADGAAVK